jgi:uncharacterized repeat protein (TIGR03803 family)
MTHAKKALLREAGSLRLGVAILMTTALLYAVSTIPSAHAQTFKVLYTFGTNSNDPRSPGLGGGSLVQGRDGNLYNAGYEGGANYLYGAAFKVTPAGTMTVVHNFGPGDGLGPWGWLTMGTDGNFYGVTDGAAQKGAFGSLFRLTPDGTLTVLHNFQDLGDGRWPAVSPIEGRDGALYGTTVGYSGDYTTYATAYRITSAGEFKTLHQFDFAGATGPLVEARDGSFFGTASGGGTNGWGTVFKMAPAGQYTAVYNFDGVEASPTAAIQGRDGNLYGTADGGANGCGVVFKISATKVFTVLHDFNAADGCLPQGLVQASDGNLYGVTAHGGTLDLGTIYRISPNSAFSVLHNFDDGYWNVSTLLQHTNGILYGLTSEGGTYGYGTFYSLNIGLPPYARLVSTSGQVGKNIGILGQGFTRTSIVSFNGVAANFEVVSDTYIEAIVPDGALTGSVTVTTTTDTLTSNANFRVTPKISSFSPTSGAPGTAVVVTGTGLTQTLRVGFGGIPATSFDIDSDTQVTAIVPDGAVTGKLAIATQGGHDTAARTFTVTP